MNAHTKQQQDKVFETDFIDRQKSNPLFAHLLALSHVSTEICIDRENLSQLLFQAKLHTDGCFVTFVDLYSLYSAKTVRAHIVAEGLYNNIIIRDSHYAQTSI